MGQIILRVNWTWAQAQTVMTKGRQTLPDFLLADKKSSPVG